MRNDKDTRERSRTTIEEARDEGGAERGEAPVVPDYADEDGTSFRGEDEPTVAPDDRGEEPVENEELGTM